MTNITPTPKQRLKTIRNDVRFCRRTHAFISLTDVIWLCDMLEEALTDNAKLLGQVETPRREERDSATRTKTLR